MNIDTLEMIIGIVLPTMGAVWRVAKTYERLGMKDEELAKEIASLRDAQKAIRCLEIASTCHEKDLAILKSAVDYKRSMMPQLDKRVALVEQRLDIPSPPRMPSITNER